MSDKKLVFGVRGPVGKAFTFEDFTPEQLEALKGEKGEPFRFEDFTPEQLELLKPDVRLDDSQIADIVTQVKEDIGELKFDFSQLTTEELALLKGEKGEDGKSFTYEDFTPEQLAALKGDKGADGKAFTYEDFTPAQLAALKGADGKPFTFGDFTEEQLASLKGEKGDAFTYEDFTPEQLEALKGEGAAVSDIDFNLLTEEQIEILHGLLDKSVNWDSIEGKPENLTDFNWNDEFNSNVISAVRNSDLIPDVSDFYTKSEMDEIIANLPTGGGDYQNGEEVKW